MRDVVIRIRQTGTAIAVFALIWGNAFAEDGKLYPDEVVVEHAEIIASASNSDRTRGYFTIWNGTDEYLYVDGFESSWVSDIRLQENIVENGDDRVRLVPTPISIPPRSELVMTGSGVHLSLNTPDQLQAGDAIPVIITFSNRDPFLARAKIILPDSSNLAEHHHGDRDG